MRHPLNSLETPCKTRGASSAHNEPSRAPRAPGAVFEGVLALASCRASAGDGGDWFETFPPYGRYPVGGAIEGAAEGAEFVLDEAAAKSVVEAFRRDAARPDWPGVLVDREHFSADRDKPSDAMAWAKDIRQEADGSVWTRWEFTAPGRELWEGRVLVSRSPLFACLKDGKDYRPVALRSIAMTNTPHFTGLSTIAAARAAERAGNGGNRENNENEGEIQMNKILEALGLAEGATEEDALAAIQGLKDRASAAEAQATEAGKKRDEAVAECRALKADAFVAANAGKIADAAACRAAYVKDPALAEAVVAACRGAAEPARRQQVLAAARGDRPPEAGGVMERLAACKSAEERCAFAVAHAKEIAEANK